MDEMQAAFEKDQRIAFARGRVEAYLENSSGSVTREQALEAWSLVEKEYLRLRGNCEVLAKELKEQAIELQKLRSDKQATNWQKEIMLVPDEDNDGNTDFAVHALNPDGEVLEIGFAYVSENFQPMFANCARPADFTPSYLRSLADALEQMKLTLPMERPKRLK